MDFVPLIALIALTRLEGYQGDWPGSNGKVLESDEEQLCLEFPQYIPSETLKINKLHLAKMIDSSHELHILHFCN